MRRFSVPLLLSIPLISSNFICFCGAFVSPIARSDIEAIKKSWTHHVLTKKSPPSRVYHRTICLNNALPLKRWSFCIASKEDDEDDDGEVKVEGKDVDQPPLAIANMTEKNDPPAAESISFNIFLFFSYCIQFLGAFFAFGLVLNLLGFGYTVDLERGLRIDRMQNIRKEVQFEREIERE